MDWSRAKSILIISFLCLNLLLFYQLWININNHAGTDLSYTELSEETYQLLNNKNIQLDSSIPKETPSLSEITVRMNEWMLSNPEVQLQHSIKDTALLSKSQLEKVLREEIFQADQYTMDTVISNQERYVLNQQYNELPMFGISLYLYHHNGEIVSYSQDYVEMVIEDEEFKEQRVFNAYNAVYILAQHYLEPGSVIVDISLGYYGQHYNSAIRVLAPQWRIVIEGGDIYYVHGINGAVQPPQKES